MLFQCGMLSPKEDIYFEAKMRNLSRTFCRIFRESNIKKGEETESRGYVVKCRKIPFLGGGAEVWEVWVRGFCENPVGLSLYEGHMETVEYIWVNIEKL